MSLPPPTPPAVSRGHRIIPGLRGRLLLSVIGALAAVLVVLTVAFNLVLADRLDANATGFVQARAAAELASLRIAHGQIRLPEAPDELSPDIQVWVFAGARALELPRTAPANDAAARVLASRGTGSHDVSSTNTRLYGTPVVQAGRRLGAVVAAASLAPYQETRRTALVASALLALAVLAAVGLAARWLIGRALRPVAVMTQQAAQWSESDLERRFSLGPPRDELTQLGSTLDDLLERLAASLRHEQRLSAEMSHELRTPLARIVAEAQYALRHGHGGTAETTALEHILESAQLLGRTLDTLMAAARAQLDPHHATSDAVACARAVLRTSLADASRPEGEGRRLASSLDAPREPIRVAVEADLVERILAPLLDNAARHARSSIELAVRRDAEGVRFTVEDDGPGIPADEHEAIFQPGRRVAEAGRTTDTAVLSAGAGLGLALCRRLARSAGGDVQAGASETGARFVVRLPSA